MKFDDGDLTVIKHALRTAMYKHHDDANTLFRLYKQGGNEICTADAALMMARDHMENANNFDDLLARIEDDYDADTE